MGVGFEALPAELAALVGSGELEPIGVGRSGSVVARLVVDGRATRILKLVDRRADSPPLAEEIARMEWLRGRFPVPEVVAHGGDDLVEWYAATVLPGVDASVLEMGTDVERLARLLGGALRRFHEALDPAACPFDGRTATLVAHAASRVEAGLVDADDFDPIHHGVTAEELLGHVVDRQPSDPVDLVVTHGDYCLPNILVDGGRVSGFVDLGLVGVGDRYRDIGIGARSVAHNLGPAAVGPFIDAYGIEWPDLARLDYFVMLDELF